MERDNSSFLAGLVSDAKYLKWQLSNRLRNRPPPLPRRWTAPFTFKGGDIAADIREKYDFGGDLVDFFAENEGGLVKKWHQYLPVYDRYFSAWRNKPVRFLEIGVSQGGSLQMWRKYFGPEARIFGIDILEACARLDGEAGGVRIGSQTDPAFLRSVVEEMGGIDLVLDDGSHKIKHWKASLEVLFPLLNQGGVYMIEDIHCTYVPDYGGGVRSRDNFFNYIRWIIDDMHRWYHAVPPRVPELDRLVSGIHVYDSIVVFEKNPVHPPVVSRVGTLNDIR